DRIARTGSHTTGATYQSDPVLGYMPKANTAGDAQFMVDGQVIFDYTYRTDAFHRRRVPAQAGQTTPRTRALLFFGCSYTFGEGVNDGETLPNQFALRAPDTAVYNYAFSGYGPHHMLARLESMDIRGEVPEPEAAAVYLFI